MKRKRLTVKEFLECKGKRQLSVLFVHNVEEASAAEEAGIDMIIAAYDIPQYGIHATLNDVVEMRKAAPNCFFQSAVPHLTFASETELIRGAYKLVEACKEKISKNQLELSNDKNCSWTEVECLGACVNAPMMQINDDYYEDLDKEKALKVLDKILKGEIPQPGSYRGRINNEPENNRKTLLDLKNA